MIGIHGLMCSGLVLPHLSMEHKYLILTTNGVMILKEVSVIDQLIHVSLLLSFLSIASQYGSMGK